MSRSLSRTLSAAGWIYATALLATSLPAAEAPAALRIGAAAVELQADDGMVTAGSIQPGRPQGQEGMLRAVATVIQGPPQGTKVAIVALDLVAMKRDTLDAAAKRIEQQTGIPFDHVLINCTHTHSAPSTIRVHAYDAVPGFNKQVEDKIVQAVVEAHKKLDLDDGNTLSFMMGSESTVGQNSRLLLSDGTIYWTGPRENVVRATGPFDPDFPVMAFRRKDGSIEAVIYGHSTHTIGGRLPGKRSPSFYGHAAQELEKETGAVVAFLEGASGSTHNLKFSGAECERRIANALRHTLDQTQPMPVNRVGAAKQEVTVRVRKFDEEEQERKVGEYCRKHLGGGAEPTLAVFRQMRRELAPYQGEDRKTWVQAVRIGDIAIVGVPAEFFTQLGIDIKKRSPFKHTIIAELANDHVGYVGNSEAYLLGGYQLWMGHHSYTERGTGELFVDTAVELLDRLHGE